VEPEIRFHPLAEENMKFSVNEEEPQIEDVNEPPSRDWLIKYMYQNIGNM